MAATALLKFTQTPLTPPAGRALIVVAGTSVTIENGDPTDVGSWRLELLYGPPGSAFEVAPGTPTLLAENSNDDTPMSSITPDASAAYLGECYRIRLTVWEDMGFSGAFDQDIRVIGTLTPNKSLVIPPYQKLPDPFPLDDKPDEMNFDGQPFGWSGPEDGAPLFRLMNGLIRLFDAAVSGATAWLGLSDTPGSFVANALYRANAGASALEDSGVKVVGSNLLIPTSASFASAHDNGNVSGSVNINFATNGQKQSMTLVGDVTLLSFTFPPGAASGFMLRIIQDGTGGHSITLDDASNDHYAKGDLEIGDAANSKSVWSIDWDGSEAIISSIANVTIDPAVANV